ncbi:MAG TPA: hypothetical protein VH590_20795, partial [Ktedonobacterales bacterium]
MSNVHLAWLDGLQQQARRWEPIGEHDDIIYLLLLQVDDERLLIAEQRHKFWLRQAAQVNHRALAEVANRANVVRGD